MRSTFRRLSVALATLVLLSAAAVAAEVDKAELEKDGKRNIVFVNYVGPYARIDSSEDILGIGLALGRAVRAGAAKAGEESRYYVVHTASAVGGKAGADVIGLGVDAGVDHIKNLRLILRGYLQAAYGYAPADAALLADFASVYNAVHRGDWKYFTGRYQDQVLATMNEANAGLSVRFDEWPGKARIVIPLGSVPVAGSLSAVDTTPLTDKKVVEELRKADDKGVEPRKDMVDLKEREAADAAQKATLQREAIAAEEKKIAADKAALQAEKDRIAAEEKKAADAKKAAPAPTPAAAQAAPTPAADAKTAAPAAEAKAAPAAPAAEQKAAEQLSQDKAAVAAKEAAVAEQEKAVAAKKEEAAKTEVQAQAKGAEAAADRKEIAKDQQQIIKKEDAAAKAAPSGELTLRLIGADSSFARFVLVDPATGSELKASLLDSVRSRSVLALSDRAVAVAGKEGGSSAVRLVAVDKASLELKKQGDDDVLADSPIWQKGPEFYAIAKVDGAYRLARFDADLKLKARSEATVHPFAAPAFAAGKVFVQGADGKALVLNEADLK